jgi:hypothetical protein
MNINTLYERLCEVNNWTPLSFFESDYPVASYSCVRNKIGIGESFLKYTLPGQAFILGHEQGHFALHRESQLVLAHICGGSYLKDLAILSPIFHQREYEADEFGFKAARKLFNKRDIINAVAHERNGKSILYPSFESRHVRLMALD